MHEAPTRKPNLLDLMLFTAATAVGLALTRYYWMTPDSLTPALDSQGRLLFQRGYPTRDLHFWATIASLFLAAWSVALLYARLRSPRPRFRAMVGTPGFLVSFVATVCVVAFFTEQFATVAREGWPDFEVPAMSGDQLISEPLDFFSLDVLPRLRSSVGLPIATALLLSLMISRRASWDWVDRLGLAVGTAWTIAYFR